MKSTDSKILEKLLKEAEFIACVSEDPDVATLRKYAAIARACEAGTHKVVPVIATEAMQNIGVGRYNDFTEEHDPYTAEAERERIQVTWVSMLAAAPQFQEEGK